MSILFVTNGHGEAAIAARIARELRGRRAEALEHFPLVGKGFDAPELIEVGPRAILPSGGLVAMGNVRRFVGDLRAGFVDLFRGQRAFLRDAAGRYDAIVAVGDVYALAMAYRARTPTVFVGTAKSEYVAPYGSLERRIMGKAKAIYVRDARTAEALQARGLAAAPANVIADLAVPAGPPYAWPPGDRIVLLPGSREEAYPDAVLLVDVVGLLARSRAVTAILSIAPSVDAGRVATLLAERGWSVAAGTGLEPFSVASGEATIARAWRGGLGEVYAGAQLALGQAGTANEAAAACGIPVVALETRRSAREGWYRMRQARLLGAALEIVPGEPASAAAAVARLLDDPERRAAMGATGRERMGRPGAAAEIAQRIGALAAGAESARASCAS